MAEGAWKRAIPAGPEAITGEIREADTVTADASGKSFSFQVARDESDRPEVIQGELVEE